MTTVKLDFFSEKSSENLLLFSRDIFLKKAHQIKVWVCERQDNLKKKVKSEINVEEIPDCLTLNYKNSSHSDDQLFNFLVTTFDIEIPSFNTLLGERGERGINTQIIVNSYISVLKQIFQLVKINETTLKELPITESDHSSLLSKSLNNLGSAVVKLNQISLGSGENVFPDQAQKIIIDVMSNNIDQSLKHITQVLLYLITENPPTDVVLPNDVTEQLDQTKLLKQKIAWFKKNNRNSNKKNSLLKTVENEWIKLITTLERTINTTEKNIDQINQWLLNSNHQIIFNFFTEKKKIIVLLKKELQNVLDELTAPNERLTTIELNNFIIKIENEQIVIATKINTIKKTYIAIKTIKNSKLTLNQRIKIVALNKINSLLFVLDDQIGGTGIKQIIATKINNFNNIKEKILALVSENIIENINFHQKNIDFQEMIDQLMVIKKNIEIISTTDEALMINIQIKITEINNLESETKARLMLAEVKKNLFLAKWIYFNTVKTATLIKINEVITAAEEQREIAEKKRISIADLSFELDALLIATDDNFKEIEEKEKLIRFASNDINYIIEDELKLIRKSIIAESFTEENWNKDFENDFFQQDGVNLLSTITRNIADKKLNIEQIYAGIEENLFGFYAESFIAEKNNLLEIINRENSVTFINLQETVVEETLNWLLSRIYLDANGYGVTAINFQKNIIIEQIALIKEFVSHDDLSVNHLNNLRETINQLQFNPENPRKKFIDKLNDRFSNLDYLVETWPIITAWTAIETAYQKTIEIRLGLAKIYNINFINRNRKEYEKEIETAQLYQKLINAKILAKKVSFWLEIVETLELTDQNFYSDFADKVQQIINKKNYIEELVENKLAFVTRTFDYFQTMRWKTGINTHWSIIIWNREEILISSLISYVEEAFEKLTELYENKDSSNSVKETINQIINNEILFSAIENQPLFNNSQIRILKMLVDAIKTVEINKKNINIKIKLIKIQEFLLNLQRNKNNENILQIFIKKIQQFQEIILENVIKTDQSINELYLILGNLVVYQRPTNIEIENLITSEIIETKKTEINDYITAIKQAINQANQQISVVTKQLKRLKILWNNIIPHLNLSSEKIAILTSWLNINDLSAKAIIDFLGSIFFKGINVRDQLGDIELSWNLWDNEAQTAEYEIHYWAGHLQKDEAVLTRSTKLTVDFQNQPYLQTGIQKTGQRGSVIVTGLNSGEWYTFTLQKVGQSTEEFTVNNFDSVYIHNGIKVILLESEIENYFNGAAEILHARHVEAVVKNEAIPTEDCVDPCDPERLAELFFYPDEDETKIIIANNKQPVGDIALNADIVNVSIAYFDRDNALFIINAFKKRYSFAETPLIVVGAGNEPGAICSAESWNFLEKGEFLVTPGNLFKTCNAFPLYLIKKYSNYANNHLIIVGSSVEEFANKPGELLKERWISTHFSWIFNSSTRQMGTSFGTPYVVKIAAEIKRRVPHYSNAEIADLIFSTAYDAGEPGTDAVYGRGILDPLEIFAELSRRGF